MYRLIWCGHDGVQQYQDFDSLVDATLTGLRLRHFYDGVEIADWMTDVPLELL